MEETQCVVRKISISRWAAKPLNPQENKVHNLPGDTSLAIYYNDHRYQCHTHFQIVFERGAVLDLV